MWSRYSHHCTSLRRFFDFIQVPLLVAVGGDACDCAGVSIKCKFAPGELTDAAAIALNEAEEIVERMIGRSVCPRFECEILPYPYSDGTGMRQFDSLDYKTTRLYGRGGPWKTVELNNWFIQPGTALYTPLETATVIYSDEDGDGFYETATISSELITGCDSCGLAIFFDGHFGDEQYLIKDFTCAEGAITFSSVDLIKPELFAKEKLFPNTSRRTTAQLNLCCDFAGTGGISEGNCPFAPSLVIASVEVSEPECGSVELVFQNWRDRCTCSCDGCERCNDTAKTGCAKATHLCNFARIIPTSEEYNCYAGCGCGCGCQNEPTQIKVNYLGGKTCDGCESPLCQCVDSDLEKAVFYIAAARMEYYRCNCECELNELLRWKEIISGDGSTLLAQLVPFTDRDSPMYGTVVGEGMRGEIRAWSILKNYNEESCYRG